LFAYHWHTNSHLLGLAAQLDEADYQGQPGYGRGSMHEIFFHLLRAMNNWRQGIETGKIQQPLKIEDFPTLASIRAGMQKEQAAWQMLLDRWSVEDIDGDVTMSRRSGDVQTLPLWRILHHLALHGMQHHAELALLLTQKGKSPGDIDFIFYE
jgi:uncharacterized damage-inducible protein DinB